MRILLFPDEQGSSGAAAPSPQTPDLAKAIEGLLSKHGDPHSALRVLLNENHDLRDRIRDLKGKVPGEGSVVLTGDDAARWTSYSALGDPKDLKKALKDGETATADLTKLRKADTYREAAELHGYKPNLLVREAMHDGLDIVFEDVKQKDGTTVRTALVKGEKDDDKTPLPTYAAAHWRDLLPALGGEGAPGTPSPSNPWGTPPRRPGDPAPSFAKGKPSLRDDPAVAEQYAIGHYTGSL